MAPEKSLERSTRDAGGLEPTDGAGLRRRDGLGRHRLGRAAVFDGGHATSCWPSWDWTISA